VESGERERVRDIGVRNGPPTWFTMVHTMVHVDPERVTARHKNIKSKIKLEALQKKRPPDILLYNYMLTVLYRLNTQGHSLGSELM
jgi:hypothetical protein